MTINFLKADWPAPDCIFAGTTTRQGGYSSAPYNGFNLASHVKDDIDIVKKNRKLLVTELGLPHEPVWLDQIHSTTVVNFNTVHGAKNKQNCADAIISFDKNKICAVLTADCVPILITNTIGNRVAAIHAGWRGLRDGIIEKTIIALDDVPKNVLIWIGPAISSRVFEVDDSVRIDFINIDKEADEAFQQSRPGHWLMDLVMLVKQRLNKSGIRSQSVFGGTYCSYLEDDLFYSYRRNRITGRMVSLIYICK